MICELSSLVLTSGQRPWPEQRRERWRSWRKHSPCAQVLVQMTWRGSARAAGWMLPEVDFTEHSPRAPHHGTSTGEFSCNSSTRGCIASTGEEARRSTDRRRMVATDPEGKHHPDLLRGEDSAVSNWRRWRRRWR
jgi:hypothetical protein